MEIINYPRTFLRRTRNVQKNIDKIIHNIHRASSVGLHLGCGTTRIAGLINCDLYEKSADLQISATNLQDFDNESVDLIEHHHMIEHLAIEEAKLGIAEWSRVLKKGGYLILTCPNINAVLIKWFLARRYWKYEYIIKMIYGPQEHDGMFHKSAYDSKRLRELLQPQGMNVEFTYTPYPHRPTPSLLVIAKKSHE